MHDENPWSDNNSKQADETKNGFRQTIFAADDTDQQENYWKDKAVSQNL